MLLLSGLGQTHEVWNRVLTRLGRDFRVIAPSDHEGHKGSYLRAREREATHALADAAPDGDLTIIGHSIGAYVAAKLAAQMTGGTSSLILLSPAGFGPTPLLWRLAPLELLLGPSLFAAIDHLPAPARSSTVWPIYSRIVYREKPSLHHDRVDDLVQGKLTTRAFLSTAHRLVAELRHHPIEPYLERVSCPIHVIAGRRDALAPTYWELFEAVGASRTVLPGCGHCPQMECPEKLLMALSALGILTAPSLRSSQP